MRVLIVGGGIAGLTLAAFLERSAIDYEIVEKSPSWDIPGFSLGMWSNGRHILQKLGLADRYDREGVRIAKYRIYTGTGRLLREYNLKDFYVRYGTAYTHIRRAHLHDWLLSKISSIKVFLGDSVLDIKDIGDKVSVTF